MLGHLLDRCVFMLICHYFCGTDFWSKFLSKKRDNTINFNGCAIDFPSKKTQFILTPSALLSGSKFALAINNIFFFYFYHSEEQNIYIVLVFISLNILIDLEFFQLLQKKIFNKLFYVLSEHQICECSFIDGKIQGGKSWNGGGRVKAYNVAECGGLERKQKQ